MANEIMVIGSENYPALTMKIEDFKEAVMDNVGSGITANDLMKIKIPAGGGTAFEVPTLEGEESMKELRGIIIYKSKANAFWAEEFGGGSVPPNCSSDDAITGHGEPGVDCATCPFNQFGSGKGGKGKACKNMEKVFLLMEGSMLPTLLILPPSSLKPLSRYAVALTQAALPLSAVVTSITLSKTKNEDGISYSECVFKLAGKLGIEERASVKAYKEAIMPVICSTKISEV